MKFTASNILWNKSLKATDVTNFEDLQRLTDLRSINEYLNDHRKLLSISYYAFFNNKIINTCIQRLVDKVIGCGLKYKLHFDSIDIDIDNREKNDIIKKFYSWAETTNADYFRQNNFHELERQFFLNILVGGDCFYTLLDDEKDVLKVRLIAPYNVVSPFEHAFNTRNSRALQWFERETLRNGVFTDSRGRIKAYSVRKYIQDEYYNMSSYASDEFMRVPLYIKYKKEMSKFIYSYGLKFSPEQRRGLPVFTSILNDNKKLEKFKDAEIMAAILSSKFSVAITKKSGRSDIERRAKNKDKPEKNTLKLEHANFIQLAPDQEIKIIESGHPHREYSKFMEYNNMLHSSNMGVPIEILDMKFTENYSSSRAGLLEFHNQALIKRKLISIHFHKIIFRRWLENSVKLGHIKNKSLKENVDKINMLYVECYGTSLPVIDPEKEVKASANSNNYGFSSKRMEMEKYGNDYDDVMEDLIREAEDYKKTNGLLLDRVNSIEEKDTNEPNNESKVEDAASVSTVRK